MTRSITHQATEWFCDLCGASEMVIRKHRLEPIFPEGWHVRDIKRPWYQRDEWELRCASCSTPSFLKGFP